MSTDSPFVLITWGVSILATAMVLAGMLWTGAFKRHAGLTVYFALILVQAAARYGCKAMGLHPFWGFWSYWFLAAGLYAVQLWIMGEMALTMAGVTPEVCTWIRRMVNSTAGCVTMITLVLSFSDIMPTGWIPLIIDRIDMAVSLGWLIVLLCIVWGAIGLGIQFRAGSRSLAIGFIIQSLSTVSVDFAMANDVKPVLLWSLNLGIYLVALVIWATGVLPVAESLGSIQGIKTVPIEEKGQSWSTVL